MKDGCIISNSGHFDIEINLVALKKMSKKISNVRPFVEEYDLGNKKICVLADGRLVNLASAEGHPSSVMDMSFANQSYGAEYIWKNASKLSHTVHTLPEEIDAKIAKLKLSALGIKIDTLTPDQKKYLGSWEEGTN